MSLAQNMTTSQYREASENSGTPIRMPATAVLTVDTADRLKFDANGFAITPSAVNNLYINTQQTLVQGYFTRLALTELNMNWNIPNVNTRNNTITLRLYDGLGGSIDVMATVDEGFYDPIDLAQAVEQELQSAIAGLVAPYPARYGAIECRYDPLTQSFEIVNVSALPIAEFLIIPKNTGATDDLCNMLGFGAIPSGSVPVARWYGGYASCQYTPYFDIVSRQLTKKQNVNDNSTSTNTGRNLLARIYLTPEGITQVPQIVPALVSPFTTQVPTMPGCRPFTIHREFQVPKQIFWDTKEFLNVIDLSLIDYKGNILYEVPSSLLLSAPGIPSSQYLGTGNANWQLTFQITET